MTTLLEEYAALALDKQTTLNRIADTAAAWRVDLENGILTLGDNSFTSAGCGCGQTRTSKCAQTKPTKKNIIRCGARIMLITIA